MPEKNDFQLYKGRPLVRSGKVIYYGFPYEPYVAMLQIMGATPDSEEGLLMSNKVLVQILSTDDSKNPAERIIKKTEKQSLSDALSIASIWLERILDTRQA